MHQHDLHTIAKTYNKFYFKEKILFFQYSHEHKNTKLNHFNSISKDAKFWVLQIYPP